MAQELTITGTIITDDEQEGVACFDRSGLTPGVVVDINYVPPQVEVIVITTGSGVTPTDIDDIATEVPSRGILSRRLNLATEADGVAREIVPG